MNRSILLVFFVFLSANSYAQEKAHEGQVIRLDDMSAFRAQAGNWRVAGDVLISPTIDIHAEQTAPPTQPAKGKKKKKDEVEKKDSPKAVTFTDGTGILLNLPDNNKKDNLLTAFEHGDIELELEVMMPKGSNSGIYLQGRYEVQLLDSWGTKNPTFGDIGGIYRNWESEPGKIYMGKAPLKNAAKAPGLWQKMKISFRAPKFDQQGRKIANAKFTSVELNGVKIHDNVEVPLPTGGPIENNEKALGPLMIQGDHGPVAFRNIRYRLMKEADISISDVSYKTYYGKFATEKDYADLPPARIGKMNELSCEILEKENEYASTYSGKISVPEDADYEFLIRFTGGGSLRIDNEELFSFQRGDGWIDQRKKIFLKAGTHSFVIQNFKDVGWMPPLLGLWVRTNTIYEKALHAYNSFPPIENPTSPILINAGSQPRLLRAFLDFKGDRAQRLTHTIGVADPSGINYVYDLNAGNVVCVWRGDFVDATPMWHDRGDGSFSPLGAVQYLFNQAPLARLTSADENFPQINSNDFRSKGYSIDDKSSRPIFRYTYQGLEVEDKIYPDDENRTLTHEIGIKNTSADGKLYFKVAEGSSIQETTDGLYSIDDKQYYIKMASPQKATIRENRGKKELIVPVATGTVKYSIIW